jgi:hypothetical protein
VPAKWLGDWFDVVWVFDLQTDAGEYTLSQLPQELLADLRCPGYLRSQMKRKSAGTVRFRTQQ